ncbi:hypothetical protein CDV31_007977 [Fusarium ambrosium]|uniref:Uncharacterized protein n=1 Tax=Fusarium ambrosium TaxID=131363 RepID=A0A428U3Q5_9HYPO|nr:hypothetical protein CDV31_007977 [Fusarium ambrosium]
MRVSHAERTPFKSSYAQQLSLDVDGTGRHEHPFWHECALRLIKVYAKKGIGPA